MKYQKLRQNIIDVVEEEQIKLGYQKETIRLYYPLASLNAFFQSHLTEAEMLESLKGFQEMAEPDLGSIEISSRKDRFCFTLPPQTAEYVHQHARSDGFLTEFIQTIGSHHHDGIDRILKIFHKYSSHVHIEKASHGEFDYLVYFEDGIPDDYRYCLTDEGGHLIYHRFTPEDYEESFGR